MIILKFGGSSIKDSSHIKNVYSIIHSKVKNDNIAIVFSAMGGTTNKLIKLAEKANNGEDYDFDLNNLKNIHLNCINDLQLIGTSVKLDKCFKNLKIDLSTIFKKNHLSDKLIDKVLSYGEILSTTIIADYLNFQNIPSEQLITNNIIITDNNFGNAYVHFQKSFNKIKNYFKEHKKTQIITGFIGSTEEGEITTLGRNGSDYTATLFGTALNANSIEIWSDVDGVLSTNPNFTKEARAIPYLTYEEAMELAHAGAEILFPPSIIPVLYKNIPIKIKNTLNPKHPGTEIIDKKKSSDSIVGISSLTKISLIRLQGAGLIDRKGTIGRIFSSLAKANINIKLISQTFSEHSICFAINPKWNEKAISTLENEFSFELKNRYMDEVIIENNLSMIAVVGEGMRDRPGTSGKVFSILGKAGVNIIAITQVNSQLNISFIVKSSDVDLAIKALHNELIINTDKQNIFLVGHGLVGKCLIDITKNNNTINLCGVMNSKKMLLDNYGLKTNKLKERLSNGTDRDLDHFIKIANSTPNSIIVDVTSSEEIANITPDLIQRGISVVTASKLANSKSQNFYNSLRKNSQNKKGFFKYGANVGAGLPIIETLQNLKATGDEIIKIEGIMSGTLSFLFSQFDGSIPFSKLVSQARKNGFTEPDPRDDLNGVDVARKILILARETKASLELKDIPIESLIPKSLDDNLSIEDFLIKFSEFDNDFFIKYQKANKENKVLRYIASWDGKNATVGLKSVGKENPFYNQSGRENFIVFKTKRYHDIPLVIKGHGAGAEVTAAAVLGDILSCKN